SKFKGCFAKSSPQRLIKMAERKMDIEEPSLEAPRSESETAVKEEAAGTADDAETRGPQPTRRRKRKSPKTKKATVDYDCAVCGRRLKQRSHLKDHERLHSGFDIRSTWRSVLEMAETKMDTEEPFLETPHTEYETPVKEEVAETPDLDDPGPRSVQCKCGHIFCFRCGRSYHDPVPCALLNKWNRQYQKYSYFIMHTKQCPKCGGLIEKSGGCNYIKCKYSDCNAEFCWICLRFTYFHFKGCNRFKEEEKGQVGTVGSRYPFFCKRFVSHSQSRKLESGLYEVIWNQKNDHSVTSIEVQYLTKAVDILLACRTVLMHAFVFAFYVRDKNGQVAIFEENQRDLEAATECLSECLERLISSYGSEPTDMADLKQKVKDKLMYCNTRKDVLL
ncbi:unnamed protein product, partial [Cyprideis torosa]